MLYFSRSFIGDHITIYNRYYLLSLSKTESTTKKYRCANNIKMENNELKKVKIKNLTRYHFDDVIKFEDSKFNNIVIYENHTKIFWFRFRGKI